MTARYISAQDIINRSAVECGLTPVSDVFASTDPAFVQLRNLITTCGQDLVEAYDWEVLRREHSITTVGATDTGEYALPTDFGRMIDQTGWERTNRLPVTGPMSPQQWAYLKGRNLVNSTIYISFRIMEDTYNVYPDDPVPDALDINFEYISRNWVIPISAPSTYEDTVQANGDIILFKPSMVVQYLRYKFLDAKGFDTQSAVGAFSKAFLQASGGNKGAPVLNAGRGLSGIPLLDYRNIPITNYGS
jgi:hypothetical protein